MDQLLQKFHQLPSQERDFLRALAVYGHPIERIHFERLNFQHKWFKPMSNADMKSCLVHLKSLNLIESWYGEILCHPVIIDSILLDFYISDSATLKATIKSIRDFEPQVDFYFMDTSTIIRDLRLALYMKDFKLIIEILNYHEEFITQNIPSSLLRVIFSDQIPKIKEELKQELPYLSNLFIFKALAELAPLPKPEDFPQSIRPLIEQALLYPNAFKGHFPENQELPRTLEAIQKLMYGQRQKALAEFCVAQEIYQFENKTRKKYLPGLEGIFYTLTLMISPPLQTSILRPLINNGIKFQKGTIMEPLYAPLHIFVRLKDNKGRAFEMSNYFRDRNYLVRFLAILSQYLIDPQLLNDHKDSIIALYNKARLNGFRWIATELAHILNQSPLNYNAEKVEETIIPLSDQIIVPESWEVALKALGDLTPAKAQNNENAKRLVWHVNFEYGEIKPIEQKILKNGKWSKGRAISLKRLKEEPIPFLSDQDKTIAHSILKYSRYYGSDEYYFDVNRTYPLLANHPLLFQLNKPETNLELLLKEPELFIQKSSSGYTLEIPEYLMNNKPLIQKETDSRYVVMDVNSNHRQIARAIGKTTLKIPLHAKDQLEEALKNISTVMEVSADFIQEGIPYVDPDTTPVIQVIPTTKGIKCNIRVQPLGSQGPLFIPGQGRCNLVAEIENKRIQTRRDLSVEINRSRDIITSCPSLSQWFDFSESILFDDPLECLELLSQLKSSQANVVWPEGEKIKLVKNSASAKNLLLKAKKQNDWFAIDGSLNVDKNIVLSLKQLILLSEKSQGRFIELDDGRYMEITSELKKQLHQLNAITIAKQEDLLLHPLAIPAVQDLTLQVQSLASDDHFDQMISRFDQMNNFTPQIPSTLNAELRPYQREGFQWLSRLAKWGVGGCLADDMGLGKTVQTIALLLERASQGPALVVAPASVCGNWNNEIRKFAPTLKPLILNGVQKNEQIENADSFDVIIVSYGILSSRNQTLCSRSWNTIVLDEAHAIKNTATKRYKAALSLKGDFRVLTTGTPIQNHLGELWGLFNFINPGLLGTADQFSKKFVVATSSEEEHKKKLHLKRLIQPFILRRTKNQVLDDLPQKTEITLEVDMSQQERALYEALREQAIENIENPDKQEATNSKHIKILAEITKLRKACCHPQMAINGSKLSSSKLELFMNTMAELKNNNHRVLVFSQFTSYLGLVGETLKEAGYSYQYLDGATPLKERDKRVRDFQSGEGDLFLISLKAGGLGLNLTAADYVIHLDPWWNPAVEDQASDRAHRFGQTRPVTIYRLICKGTIEEKIVKLHRNKREMAYSLLEGSDKSSRLSVQELLKILKEN